MPKRLLITLEYFPQIGGIASYVHNFAKHLNKEETVLYAPASSGSAKFDEASGLTVYRRSPFFLLWWPRWLKLLFQVWWIIAKETITEIHVHQALPVGYIALFFKKFKNIPYVLFLHGSDLEYGLRPAKRFKFKHICTEANRLVVNSEFLRHKLESKIDNLPTIQVIYPGPSDVFFKPVEPVKIQTLKSRLGLSGKKILLTVSRLVDGKGLPQMLTCLAKLVALDSQVVWVLVGTGPKMSILSAAVQKLNLQNSVRFIGDVANSELPNFYHLADIFSLLTHPDLEAEEGWGTVFLEASASGLPIVAGRVGGVDESVINGLTGFVVEANNTTEVFNAFTELLSNLELRHQMGEAGKQRVYNEFRWEIQINKFLAT
ncbi:MAG: glycosyltransferase family 4 protein [Candidatus Magasanikbacteria bacterium]|nr:glycosyltransferase family 4 protein [Candidatus Magasanikbacteria bacterium]